MIENKTRTTTAIKLLTPMGSKTTLTFPSETGVSEIVDDLVNHCGAEIPVSDELKNARIEIEKLRNTISNIFKKLNEGDDEDEADLGDTLHTIRCLCVESF